MILAMRRSASGVLVSALTLLLSANAQAQPVIHVDARATPGGDGASWQTAYRDLQDALDHSRSDPSVREIWIAGGLYKPDRSTGDRDASFLLVSQVGLFGGFQGNELSRPPRSNRTTVTILSGDIGILNDPTDNSKTIVEADLQTRGALLDGVSIMGGNGTWGALQIHGQSTRITVSGCRFSDNLSIWGGAIFSNSDIAAIADCVFERNTANHGGAIYLNNIDTTTEIVNCRFYNNHARGFGGAVANSSSHPIFRNCTFINNRADREGGALSNSGGDTQFVNSILWNNTPNEIRNFKSSIAATYSCIAGGWPGEGNFSADPLLVDPSGGDLRLAPNSPCIDAGDNDGVPPEQTLDLDFNPRFADDPGTPDIGRGTAPIVDLGCYEFQGTSFALLEPIPGEAGRVNRLTAIGANPGATIWFVYGRREGSTPIPGCPGVSVLLDAPAIIGSAVADAEGVATLDRFVPLGARGVEILLQCVDRQHCRMSRIARTTFE